MQEEILEKFTEFLAANNRIANECEAALPLARDPEVIKAFQFLSKLNVLAKKYQFEPCDIILLLDPSHAADIPNEEGLNASTLKRKPRQVKCYRNPHTGQVIETRGANHKLLKQWKAVHGAKTVEGWRDPLYSTDEK